MHSNRALVAWLVLLPALAAGDKPEKGKKGHGEGQAVTGESAGVHAELTVTFGARERETARGWFVETHGKGKCPPGLAKKHNGCLPPGQAKKRYLVGQPLPPILVYAPPPPELARRLGPPPHGYLYVMVDGDLVKLVAGTMMVVDAVQALVD